MLSEVVMLLFDLMSCFYLEFNDAILSSIAVFLGWSTTWIEIYFAFSKCSFEYCASTSPFLCKSNSRAWLLAHPSTCSAHFLTTFDICFDISHPTIPHLSRCQCGHTINNLGIHLLYCFCGSEHTSTHDTFWNIVVTVMSKNGAHVQRKVSHLFPPIHRDELILSSP
jgi:hypothetical protein